MTDHSYPEGITITTKDFSDCGWKDVLAGVTRSDSFSLWKALSDAEKSAIDKGRYNHGKVLSLLASVCSMTLTPQSPNEPFKPMIVSQFPTTDDFLDEDISFFAEAVYLVEDPWLKARLADLVWLKQRDYKFALQAVDSYRLMKLCPRTWAEGTRECWQRATSIVISLGQGAVGPRAEMAATLLDTCKSQTDESGHFALELSDLLASYPLDADQHATVAAKLESLANDFENKRDFLSAYSYYQGSTDWYARSGDQQQEVAATIAMAECQVQGAESHVSTAPSSHLPATIFYEQAIQIYRTIPKVRRTPEITNRMAELQSLLYKAGVEARNEMQLIQTPEVDVSQIMERARESVRGKGDKMEALRAFATIREPINVSQLRESSRQLVTQHPLLQIFPIQHFASDGRIIHRNAASDEKGAILFRMAQMYVCHVRLVTQARILPAMQVLLLEHRFSQSEIIMFTSGSPFVPLGRKLLFGKGLFAGFERDFATALHLLVPQIEHIIRDRLQREGVNTSHFDQKGIQMEVGLSSLMELPESQQILGEPLSYEIRTLLCRPFLPNFRNNVAHGLLDDYECNSLEAVYVWWLALSLAFKSYWHLPPKTGY